MTQSVMVAPLPPSSFVSVSGAQLIQNIVNGQSQSTFQSLSQYALPFEDNHVFVHLGAASRLGALVEVAGIRSGLIKRLLMVDKEPEKGLARPLLDYARKHHVNVKLVSEREGNAIIASGDGRGRIPSGFIDAIRDLGGKDAQVSLIDTIGLARRGASHLLVGSRPANAVVLKDTAHLARMTLTAATQTSQDNIVNYSGANHGVWRSGLNELGLLGPSSIGIAFSWWGEAERYGISALAKRKLEADTNDWYESHQDKLGRHRVVMMPAIPTPGLTAAYGIITGLEAFYARERHRENIPLAELGALVLLATLHPRFSHPSLALQSALLRFDRGDREKGRIAEISAKRTALDQAVPSDLSLQLSAVESDELLKRHMEWPETWKDDLAKFERFE